ncbi:MAG TPA: DNA-3-methyladenine glycosylase I [Gammaproteobacteria bacterium]|nr:DNA-3-methyladenine glycosylase I [Gammaproteobacteria bacterium]
MRCFGEGDALYEQYHDAEWGRPVTDERGMYERLCLEAFQAGLSWRTVLHKREAFREAFVGFDPERVARYGGRDLARLMKNEGIIRNRLKIEAAVSNARALLALRDAGGSIVQLIWSFAPTRSPRRRAVADMPAQTPASQAMSKALRAKGFRFVGPTTAYATMQAAGLVNDHVASCAVRAAVERERAATIKRFAS